MKHHAEEITCMEPIWVFSFCCRDTIKGTFLVIIIGQQLLDHEQAVQKTEILDTLNFFPLIIKSWIAPSWCRRHTCRTCDNRKLPYKPIVCIVFMVLLSFCSLLFYVDCVFYTK